ncbi:TPA: signal peptidase I [Candidatus Campbellbacteria bacterium]|nr:MAG: Peptidase S26B, signal peptidase [Candidatus Campbellbacteria bacterium GW2011_GWD2_35_24]KKP75747.1 MAG: type I signal peptidase, signal peptidase, endoplasmic reticulum-type [Candidatus Campbellbacteria bacterium GW2011_GWC2_35_28]KKP77005.1 MAG: Type I signal peptidase [Candidatus Campbellbacteria bacterium GW2011_GWC1_35_31]KKP78931.1 MAG: Peptidase S26B, signal peptidase [Candidatus Campbellbacteria bacterium GW2011_GWD1_35_49]HAP74148.1 signal peptidase I [Candidatus Campbellbacte
MNKLIKIIYYIVVFAIFLMAVLMIASIFPITGNYELRVVQSGSMEPAIKTGSVAVIKPSDDYQVGDVITFGDVYKSETPITHRIVDIKVIEGDYYYITKGDANDDKDPKDVPKEDVIGKVLFSLPYAGYVVQEARKPFGFAILIIIPGVIIVYDESKKIWKEIKKTKKSNT